MGKIETRVSTRGRAHVRLRNDDIRIIRLLEFGAFERRSRGGWRFGTKTISDAVAERLISSGRAEIIGDRLQLTRREAAE
ncbi:hypothetical protein QA635_32445 [Bradyrhizobium brasilense]|uniref:hypothetical protein n=1 Tax=Bradyrhizobium brasilense TaxID=1419277 RepID=UPI0024B18EA0|nr:hypothetical protein [Bradyrhizobium australafricanum]WFU31237.1 hypothetical protein QA635_32445 [Bradyrhizobium australafricanum]